MIRLDVVTDLAQAEPDTCTSIEVVAERIDNPLSDGEDITIAFRARTGMTVVAKLSPVLRRLLLASIRAERQRVQRPGGRL